MFFSARASGGPKRPTTPTYGAAGGNFWGVRGMVYDIAIKTPFPTTPKTSACGAGKGQISFVDLTYW